MLNDSVADCRHCGRPIARTHEHTGWGHLAGYPKFCRTPEPRAAGGAPEART